MWFSHIYLRKGISADLAKVEYIKAQRAPQSTEKVKSFLQMKDTIAMRELTRVNTGFEWMPTCRT